MAAGPSSQRKDKQKLSKVNRTKTKQAVFSDSTDSSDSEQELPTLSEIRSPNLFKRKLMIELTN